MNRFAALSLIILCLFTGCEKDDFKRDEIIGNWTLEQIQIDTVVSGQLTGDSIVVYGHTSYIITMADTLSIMQEENTAPLLYLFRFVSPDRIRMNNCPVDYLCLYGATVEYKITGLTSSEMVWHRTLDRNEQRTLKETLFFSK